jgi:hypothetical protein
MNAEISAVVDKFQGMINGFIQPDKFYSTTKPNRRMEIDPYSVKVGLQVKKKYQNLVASAIRFGCLLKCSPLMAMVR